MRIVCDSHIPFIVEAIRNAWPRVDICPLKPEEIDADAVQNADVLVVRTRTKVNEALLSGSTVKLVCTATIGFDHIDTAYCDSHHIRWTSCPGCNAQAVCDYIEEALNELNARGTIGIVGVGHVGSLVAQMAERKGLKVLLNDPPKHIGIALETIAAKADIITFHTPLDASTHHLCDASFLSLCKPNALIINAARGGVVDEQALLRNGHPYIIDTWENEPDIDPAVLQHARLATMHIAGYSVQGKRNASQMCLDEIAATFGLNLIDISKSPYLAQEKGDSAPGWISRISTQLKANPTAFETLRKAYPLREE